MGFTDFESISNSWWPYIISGFISVIAVIRLYMAGPKCSSENRIDNQIVLITGATSGIGLETAKELALRGAKIIFTGRTLENIKLAVENLNLCVPNAKIETEVLDVSNLEEIRCFVKKMNSKYKKIDVLINNAGIIFHPYFKTKDNLEITIATNYFGPFLLTHLLLPLLNESDNGRIINMSSMAHYAANIDVRNLNCEKYYNDKEVFGQSKLALILFALHMSKLLKKTKITINSVSPGLVRNTKHFGNSPTQNSWMIRMSTLPWVWLFLKSPKQGCQTVVYAAVDPILNTYTARYFSDCDQKEPSNLAQNEKLAEELYDKSLEYCKLDGLNIINKL